MPHCLTPRLQINHGAERVRAVDVERVRRSRAATGLQVGERGRADDVDEYPVSSPVESDCFGDSESEPDARFATYTGAISVYGEFRDRRGAAAGVSCDGI